MSEQPPQPEKKLRFASERDHALFILKEGLWGTATSGDPTSATGRFTWMSNAEVELPDIIDAFVNEFAEIGFTDYAALVGNYIVFELHDQVFSHQYDTEAQAVADFQALKREYEGGV